jgi:hypothetical protein
MYAGVSVDDLDAACKRFENQGVNWKKRLTDGRMKNVAFILDPDKYVCNFSEQLIPPFGQTQRLFSMSRSSETLNTPKSFLIRKC